MSNVLDQLVTLTRALGEPERDYVLLGEGNTSHRIDADTFWIKASGGQMHTIGVDGFVTVHRQPILDLLDQPDLTPDGFGQGVRAAKVDLDAPGMPSTEVGFHAVLMDLCGAVCVAHTHPTAANAILCSSRAEDFAYRRLLSDEIIHCGPRSVFIPYADPGLALARAVRERVRAHIAAYGDAPKVILLGNHGLVVAAGSASEALNVTAMVVKAARVFAGACAIGEPVFLSDEAAQTMRDIYKRRQGGEKS